MKTYLDRVKSVIKKRWIEMASNVALKDLAVVLNSVEQELTQDYVECKNPPNLEDLTKTVHPPTRTSVYASPGVHIGLTGSPIIGSPTVYFNGNNWVGVPDGTIADTTVISTQGHGYTADTSGILRLDLGSQTVLANISHSLTDLHTRTGNIGTVYFTITSNMVTAAFKSDGPTGTAVFWPYPSLKQELSRTVKHNLLIQVKSRKSNLPVKWSPEEQKARDTLRDMLTEKDWRRYITNGFVMVRGSSGYWYQIFANSRERIQVYRDNKRTHRICIHSDPTCPPTDHVINMLVMVELDEQWVWQNGNVFAGKRSQLDPTWSSSLDALQKKESILDAYKRVKGTKIPSSTNMSTASADSLTFNVAGSNQLVLAC